MANLKGEDLVVVDEENKDAEQVRDEKSNIHFVAVICMTTEDRYMELEEEGDEESNHDWEKGGKESIGYVDNDGWRETETDSERNRS